MTSDEREQMIIGKLDELQVEARDQIFAYLLLRLCEHLDGVEFQLERIADFLDGDRP